MLRLGTAFWTLPEGVRKICCNVLAVHAFIFSSHSLESRLVRGILNVLCLDRLALGSYSGQTWVQILRDSEMTFRKSESWCAHPFAT